MGASGFLAQGKSLGGGWKTMEPVAWTHSSCPDTAKGKLTGAVFRRGRLSTIGCPGIFKSIRRWLRPATGNTMAAVFVLRFRAPKLSEGGYCSERRTRRLQAVFCERSAGSGFQITPKLERTVAISKRHRAFDLPRAKSGGVGYFSCVVPMQSISQIIGEPDVVVIW